MKLALLSVLCFSLSLTLPRARGHSFQDAGELPSPWLIRAQTLTDDIFKDGEALASADRALLMARLAESWWKHDERRARVWLLRAVEEVEGATLTETRDERLQKIETARRLVRIVAPLDARLLDRVGRVLVAASDPTSGVEPGRNADALIAAAARQRPPTVSPPAPAA